MEQTKTIEAVNVLGVKRIYKFTMMDAETGTKWFHKYAGEVAQSYEQIMGFYKRVVSKEKEDIEELFEHASLVMEIVRELPDVLTWGVVKEMSVDMLAGHTMTEDNKTFTANEKGFQDEYSDTLEVYCALFNAIYLNYEKYIAPLFSALAENGSSND